MDGKGRTYLEVSSDACLGTMGAQRREEKAKINQRLDEVARDDADGKELVDGKGWEQLEQVDMAQEVLHKA